MVFQEKNKQTHRYYTQFSIELGEGNEALVLTNESGQEEIKPQQYVNGIVLQPLIIRASHTFQPAHSYLPVRWFCNLHRPVSCAMFCHEKSEPLYPTAHLLCLAKPGLVHHAPFA